MEDLRDSLRVKYFGCSSIGPRLSSQHRHGSLRLPITPEPGNPIPSYGLLGYQAHMCYTYLEAVKALIHINEINIFFNSHGEKFKLMSELADWMAGWLTGQMNIWIDDEWTGNG